METQRTGVEGRHRGNEKDRLNGQGIIERLAVLAVMLMLGGLIALVMTSMLGGGVG